VVFLSFPLEAVPLAGDPPNDRASLLRRALASAPAVKAPTGLADRIVRRALEQTAPRVESVVAPPEVIHSRALLRPAAVLSLCFAVGITVGLLPAQGDGVRVDFPTVLARLID
jgi:hypothetical protein